jgi:hypothetical protein
MAKTITVPASFVDDFKYFCERAGLDRMEQDELRAQVRADFAGLGAHITETAAVYRFCDKHWGGLPTAELARGFCAVFKWYADGDEGMWTRLGPLLLGKLCAQVYGAVPWPKPPAE